MKLIQPDDATPIRPEDLDDLIPDLKTQEELNEFEQRNIGLAEQWANALRVLPIETKRRPRQSGRSR
jgi:hypothetical protein